MRRKPIMQGFYIERKELVTERTSSLILGGSGLWPYPQETSKSDPRLGSWRSLAVSVPPIWPQVGSDFISVRAGQRPSHLAPFLPHWASPCPRTEGQVLGLFHCLCSREGPWGHYEAKLVPLHVLQWEGIEVLPKLRKGRGREKKK